MNATPASAAAELEPRTDTGNGPLRVGGEFTEAPADSYVIKPRGGRARFLEPGKHTQATAVQAEDGIAFHGDLAAELISRHGLHSATSRSNGSSHHTGTGLRPEPRRG